MLTGERDWPEGHPASADYDPHSEAARRWRDENVHPAGQRDWPKGHPGAADNPNRVEPTYPLDTAVDHTKD